MPPKPVTLKHIAKETGLTVATVSRALSGKDRISPATRQKVQETAERLGYHPDPVLSRLAAYRNRDFHAEPGERLAVISDFPGEIPDFVRPRFQGVQNRAAELGYGVETHTLASANGKPARLAAVLKARGISGLLVERINQPGSFADFPWDDFVAVGLGKERLPLPTVTDDLFTGTRLAITHIHRHGYQRIGLILLFGDHPDPLDRILAATALEQQIHADELTLKPCELQPAATHTQWSEQITGFLQEFRPQAILFSSGLLAEFHTQNLTLPTDLPYATVGSFKRLHRDDIAGARSHLQDVGRTAVDILHHHLHHPVENRTRLPVLHLIPPTWINGHTLPANHDQCL